MENNPQEFYDELVLSCKEEFNKAGIKFHNPVFKIDGSGIEISVSSQEKDRKTLFASDIQMYSDNRGLYKDENKINFGASGSFTPNNEASYWRTIHAANILLNWDKACVIVNSHCKKYRDFISKIS